MFGFAGFTGSAVAMAVLGAAPIRLTGRLLAVAGAVLLLIWIGAISSVVFEEDTYIADGSSRWATRGAGEHALYLTTAGVALTVAAVLGLLAIRNSAARRVRGVLLVTGIPAFFAGFAVLVAFASN